MITMIITYSIIFTATATIVITISSFPRQNNNLYYISNSIAMINDQAHCYYRHRHHIPQLTSTPIIIIAAIELD
jgi:hypothetical protein